MPNESFGHFTLLKQNYTCYLKFYFKDLTLIVSVSVRFLFYLEFYFLHHSHWYMYNVVIQVSKFHEYSLQFSFGVHTVSGFPCLQPSTERRLSHSTVLSGSSMSAESISLQPDEEKFRTLYSKRLTIGEIPTQVCFL